MPVLGYRLGFAIAALLAVGFGLLTRELAAINRLTAPTPLLTQTAALQPLTSEVSPAAIVRSDASGDARASYQTAIDDLRRDPTRYAAAESAADPAAFEASPACDALLAATNRAGDALPDPDGRAGYRTADDEDLAALSQAARLLGRSAVLRLPTDPARAKALFEAQFALGAKLFADRVRYAEAAVGLAAARDAVAGLRQLATQSGDARRAAVLATFDRAAGGLLDTRLGPIWNAVGAVDGGVIAEHAGDVFALTDRRCAERMWRVEAILALGRHRFNLDRPADRLAVPGRLAELEAGEKDAVVLAAIHAAQRLTIEEYRTLR